MKAITEENEAAKIEYFQGSHSIADKDCILIYIVSTMSH